MVEHTPTPWNIDAAPDSNYGCQIAANTKVKAKRVVCRLGGPDREANAALIVKAVNNHEALVKALTAATRIVADRAAGGRMLTNKEDAEATRILCNEALAGVVGGPRT